MRNQPKDVPLFDPFYISFELLVSLVRILVCISVQSTSDISTNVVVRITPATGPLELLT